MAHGNDPSTRQNVIIKIIVVAVDFPMKPLGYAVSIIGPPRCLARARCFDEEPHTSRVGRSPLHEGDSEERYQQ
jgi:hypothetical protein